VRLDHSVDGPISEPRADPAGGGFGCLKESIGVSDLDLVAKWGSLTVADRWIPATRRHTASGQGFRRNADEAGASHLGDDSLFVMVAVRSSRQKERWVIGEQLDDGCGDKVRELVVFDPVPDAEDEVATGLQDAPCFPIGFLSGKNITPN
jgi:hypothetical protein